MRQQRTPKRAQASSWRQAGILPSAVFDEDGAAMKTGQVRSWALHEVLLPMMLSWRTTFCSLAAIRFTGFRDMVTGWVQFGQESKGFSAIDAVLICPILFYVWYTCNRVDDHVWMASCDQSELAPDGLVGDDDMGVAQSLPEPGQTAGLTLCLRLPSGHVSICLSHSRMDLASQELKRRGAERPQEERTGTLPGREGRVDSWSWASWKSCLSHAVVQGGAGVMRVFFFFSREALAPVDLPHRAQVATDSNLRIFEKKGTLP